MNKIQKNTKELNIKQTKKSFLQIKNQLQLFVNNIFQSDFNTMGCSESKTTRPNLNPYYKTYSFDEFLLREIEEIDLSNGKIIKKHW